MTLPWKPLIQKGDTPLYLAIVKAISDDIAGGILTQESRLPTHRELADELKIAIGTVTRAYDEAEKRGIIRSEGRRGTFIGQRRYARESLAALSRRSDESIDLSRNHPPYGVDPILSDALRLLLKRPALQEMLRYPPPPGIETHREAGALWLNQLGIEASAESIFVTMGAQHGILVALAALADPGEFVVSECFTYPGLVAAAEMVGLQVIGAMSDQYGMLPDSFESACRQHKVRIVYLNPTLHNPTNVTYPLSRRQDIAAIAEKYDILILEDDIFRALHPQPPPTISGLAPERSCIVVSASKTIAAGLRVGFISVPPALRNRISERLQITLLGAPPLTTEILANWITNGTARRIVEERRQELDYRQKMTSEILSEWDIRTASAGCSAWLCLPEKWTGSEFSMETQRRGVAISPAEIFAVGRKIATNAVRISVGVAPNRETLQRGLEILAGILRGNQRQSKISVK